MVRRMNSDIPATIHIVGPADAHLLENIAEDVFDEQVTPDLLADYLAEPNHVLCVAVLEGVVIGQARAIIHKHPDNTPELYIDNVGVCPRFQRNGIGLDMVTELFAIGRARHCTDVWVATEADNAAARAFYKSFDLTMEPMVMFDGEL